MMTVQSQVFEGKGVAIEALVEGLGPPVVMIASLGRPAQDVALAGYVSGTSAGMAGWLVHWAQAVALGGQAGRAVAESVRGL